MIQLQKREEQERREVEREQAERERERDRDRKRERTNRGGKALVRSTTVSQSLLDYLPDVLLTNSVMISWGIPKTKAKS